MSENNVNTKTYFLDSSKHFVEVELVKETSHKRQVKVLEGVKKGKIISVHPHGVAWGRVYPRIFHSKEKPTDVFNFKGRVLLKNKNSMTDKNYRFQPFLSHVIDGVNSKENILLTGGTGVGKTTHVVKLAEAIGQDVLRVNFNAETRLSDFVGKMHVINGETRWVDGILPMAMRKGMWLLMDEIDMADPSILSLLHPILEPNPVLVLKENGGEAIKAHPNFQIFATANSVGAMQDRGSTYTGTNQLNEAFLDRWIIIHVQNLVEKEEIKVVKSNVRGLKNRWAKRIVEFANLVRNNDNSLGIDFNSDNFSTRRVITWAQKTALLCSPIEGAKLAWVDKVASGERETLMRVLDTHFGNEKKKKSLGADSLTLLKKKRGRPVGSKNKLIIVETKAMVSAMET